MKLAISHFFLQMGDILSTHYCLSRGGYERNPFMVQLVENHPLWSFFVKVIVASTIICLYFILKRMHKKTAMITLSIINIFYLAVVIINIVGVSL